MNRFKENSVTIGEGIELTEDEILKLEIEMINLGRIIETYKLEYTDKGQLVVAYEPKIEFMDQQTQKHNRVGIVFQVQSIVQPVFRLQSIVQLVFWLQSIVQPKEVLLDNPVGFHTLIMVLRGRI